MIKNNLSNYKTTINASVESVWKALTDPEIVKQYFFGTNQQSTYKVGSPITWEGEYEGKKYLDKGEILECEPLKKLSYSYFSSWSGREDKPENYLWIAYELVTLKSGAELSVTFSSYNEESAKHSESNWAMVVGGLKKLVE
jgi:Uncharacterized conserved protein